MAWWTKSGWKPSWGTRWFRKKAARVASRRADRTEATLDMWDDPWAPWRPEDCPDEVEEPEP